MKGLVKTARGFGNLEVREVPEPAVGAGEVKIRVQAAGVCGTDVHIYRDEYPYTPPVVLGHELAGLVVEVGAGVERVRPGDRVTCETFAYTCGHCRYCRAGRANLCLQRRSIGSHVNGAFAPYLTSKEMNVHRLPENVDYLAGALTEPLACCVHGLLDGAHVGPGDVVVISGPGAIGLLCLQVCRAAGATTVVLGAAGDEGRLALAGQLGATVAADVSQIQAADIVRDLTDGWGADVVVECAGAGASVRQCLELVRKGGQMLQMGLFGQSIAVAFDAVPFKELHLAGSFAHVPSAWPRALQLLAQGQVKARPLVTATFPLAAWEQAFTAFSARSQCKIVFLPQV